MRDRPIVVIIEPENEFARDLRVDLEKHGIEAADTGDGMTGVDLCRQDMPNAIILCVELQSMSGYKICSMLKKDPDLKDIPVVMTSRQKSDADFEPHRALKNPAQAYFNKATPIPEISKTICELIGHPVSAVSLPPPPPQSDQSTDLAPQLTENEPEPRPSETKDIDSSLVIEEVDETTEQELLVESDLVPVDDQEQDLIPMEAVESETFTSQEDALAEVLPSDENLVIAQDDSIPVDNEEESTNVVIEEPEASAEELSSEQDPEEQSAQSAGDESSAEIEAASIQADSEESETNAEEEESIEDQSSASQEESADKADQNQSHSEEVSQQAIPTRDIPESAQEELAQAAEDASELPPTPTEEQVPVASPRPVSVTGYEVEFSDIPSPDLSNSEVVSFVDAALGELIEPEGQSVASEELKLMTAEVEFLKSRVIELEQEKVHLKSTFEENDSSKPSRISVSNRETLALKKERNDLRKELLSIKAQLAERDAEILKWSDRETELETELVDIADENDKLLNEKAYLENELVANKDSLTEIREEHDRVILERDRLLVSEKTNESRIEELRLETEELRSQIPEEGTKERLVELESELDMAKTNIDALKASVRIKEDELVSHRQFVEDKNVQNEQLQTGLDRARIELDQAEQEKSLLREALDDAELQKETLSGELEEYERVVELAAEKRLKALTAMQIAQQLLHESAILTQEDDDYPEEYSQDLYSQDISQDLINEVQSEIGEALASDKPITESIQTSEGDAADDESSEQTEALDVPEPVEAVAQENE